MTEAPRTLTELSVFFEDIQKTVQENAFYFWHHAQLAQISPAIKKMQSDTFSDNMALLTPSFHSLKKDGVLREERYQGEYSRLIDTLLITSIYWAPFCKLKEVPTDTFVEQAWSIMYTHLYPNKMEAVTSDLNRRAAEIAAMNSAIEKLEKGADF